MLHDVKTKDIMNQLDKLNRELAELKDQRNVKRVSYQVAEIQGRYSDSERILEDSQKLTKLIDSKYDEIISLLSTR